MKIKDKLKEAYESCLQEAEQTAYELDSPEFYNYITTDHDLGDGFFIEIEFAIQVSISAGDWYTPEHWDLELQGFNVNECLVGHDYDFNITELADVYLKSIRND